MLTIVKANTTKGSHYYTHKYRAYASLRLRGTHVTVAKEKGIPKGRTHINGIEGFWSYTKH
jgi:transposase